MILSAGKRFKVLGAAAGLLALAAPIFAQDAPAKTTLTQEDIAAIVQEVVRSHPDQPSVLGGIDLRRASPDVQKIARTLQSTRVNISLDHQSVEDTLQLLRQISGLNFVISARARKALGESAVVEPARKGAGARSGGGPQVSLELRDIPLENALNLLSLRLEDYRFTIAYGAVILVHKDEHRPKNVFKTYPIGDLIQPVTDFAAPTLALPDFDDKNR